MNPMTAVLPPGETTEDDRRTRALQAALVSMPTHHHVIVPGDVEGLAQPDGGGKVTEAFPTETWTIHLAAGPVPFIGDPARETAQVVWRVATCDDGRRQVASTFARLEIRSRDTGVDLTSWRQWELRQYGSAS